MQIFKKYAFKTLFLVFNGSPQIHTTVHKSMKTQFSNLPYMTFFQFGIFNILE